MIAQCLYQSDPKNLASMGRQRLACQRAARKLQWGVQKERISETNEPVPLLMRPAVKEILQDAEQHRFDVLLIGNRDSLCCDAADMESFLTVLNSFNIHIFAGGQGSWVEPNGRHSHHKSTSLPVASVPSTALSAVHHSSNRKGRTWRSSRVSSPSRDMWAASPRNSIGKACRMPAHSGWPAPDIISMAERNSGRTCPPHGSR